METDEPSPGAVAFEVGGKTYRLDAITEKGNPQFFMIFADDTRGKETYGAGRYLYIDPPDANNRIVIDFNKAYSPPCAFTNFATCPLPPQQNILPIGLTRVRSLQVIRYPRRNSVFASSRAIMEPA